MQLDKKHFRLKLWSIRLAKSVAFGGSPQAEMRSKRRFVLFLLNLMTGTLANW